MRCGLNPLTSALTRCAVALGFSMPCFKPLTAFRSRDGPNPSGKWPLTFDSSRGYPGTKMELPCGQCIGCRLEKSRQWAIRCVHEASLHPKNCFLTLTYNDDNLPPDNSLNKRDIVLFLKRLRKKYGDGIRFFQCGEYGDLLSRPHHHVCLFNHDFVDKYLWSKRDNILLYRSDSLEDLWHLGNSTIGDVTFESAAYVARYVTKKINGKNADKHYNGRQPEYITMSRRPGIGKGWYDEYKQDVYGHDKMVVRNNLICRPPRYYDVLYDRDDPTVLQQYKQQRQERAKLSPDTTPDRLAVRERLQELRAKKLIRTYETLKP